MTQDQSEIKSKLGLERRRRVSRGTVLALIVAVLGSLVWFFESHGIERSTQNYRVIPATRGDLVVTVNATGSVEPTDVVDISSEQSGTIAEVFVDFNDAVTAGAVLARLKTEKLEALVAVQHANLRARRRNWRARAPISMRLA